MQEQRPRVSTKVGEDSSGSNNVRYVDTATAYDMWSEVYDTDGNFLQALDTIEMKTLLPKMLSLIEVPKPWKIVDLGCGTGRNTMALLQLKDTEVVGLDLSKNMLNIARQRLEESSERLGLVTTLTAAASPKFEIFDMLSTSSSVPAIAKHADAVISTLVVEHVPADVYFETAARILKPGGLFLVTNMHSEMGGISQAGFVDPKTGEKIRPTSYAHTVEEIVAEAVRKGFEVLGRIEERAVDTILAPKLGPRASKWVGVTVWFGGIFRRNTS